MFGIFDSPLFDTNKFSWTFVNAFLLAADCPSGAEVFIGDNKYSDGDPKSIAFK